jgi:peptidylprolyl isomerase
MKSVLPLIASLILCLTIAACGGSSSSSDSGGSQQVTSLTKTDTVVGNGAEATTTSKVTINYTAWLYDANAADKRGTKFASSSDAGSAPLTIIMGTNQVITGLEQGLIGMKVGGKRTLIIPSLFAYGSGGSGPVPGNTAVIFDVELTAAAPAVTVIDTVVGTGAVATSTSQVTVHYTGWLYDATKPSFHGLQFDTSIGKPAPFSFKLGTGAVIAGWEQGVVGMKVGGKRTLIIPSALGYGAIGSFNIPPNTDLVFDIELLSITN